MGAPNPGVAYLAGRGILADGRLPRGIEWIPAAELAGVLRARYFPMEKYRADGGDRRQRRGGFPDDIAGILRYWWRDRAGEKVAYEFEGILADGTRAGWTNPKTGDRVKRPTPPGPGIGYAAFVVRLPMPGGRLHVAEGAVDALSVDRLDGLAAPTDGILGFHGCYGLRDAEPWCSSYTDIRIYPHHQDKGDIGEKCADALAAKLGGRARVVRSAHDQPHDLNDELLDRAPRRGATSAGAVLIPAAEWMKTALLPPAVELTPTAPGLLYASTPVLCHADRGVGKSTYAAWAVAEATKAGLSVVLIVDDDPSSWAIRLRDFEAIIENVQIGEMADLAPAGAVEQHCAQADVVILDSWRRWCGANRLTKPGVRGDSPRHPVRSASGRRFRVLSAVRRCVRCACRGRPSGWPGDAAARPVDDRHRPGAVGAQASDRTATRAVRPARRMERLRRIVETATATARGRPGR